MNDMATLDDKSRLSYWYPRIKAAGLPVPETVRIPATQEEVAGVLAWFDSDVNLVTSEGPIDDLAYRIQTAAGSLGPPVFLGTDHFSAKHSWRHSCYLANTETSTIVSHVLRIAEDSQLVDLVGLPFDVWHVRKMIPTAPLFEAFYGEMPIAREFRLFVKDGQVVHCQPYWPPDAFDEHTPSRRDWKARLAQAAKLTLEEDLRLQSLARAAGLTLGGFWSVDLLQAADESWWLTDMAAGERSYMWGSAF